MSDVTKPKTEADEAAEAKIDGQIDEYVKMFDDPGAPFEDKMRALIEIPKELQFQHNLLTQPRANRLFARIPIEMYQRVFEPKHDEYAYARPILIHILGFLCQCTSEEVSSKFKPLLENVVKSVSPKENKSTLTSTVYNDLAIIVAFWANSKGEGKYIYEALRHTTGYFVSQKERLDVLQFLLSVRLLISKIYQLAPLENLSAESFDKRGWPVAVLSVIRQLLRERHEKFTKDMRSMMWDVISSMTRIGGIGWFNIDKNFAKLVIQMNHIEMQMSVHDPEKIDVVQFSRHLRVLELYTTAICDKEMYGEEGMEVIPHTVGDSTRFILYFWVEAYLQKIELPEAMNLSIFNFATFLFVHEELALTDEKVRKHIGSVMLENAFLVLREASASDLRGEVGQMFGDIIERLSEFELLDERVPVFIMKFLHKIRIGEDYEGWKGRVIDCKCCLMDLRGRVDWYSVKAVNEAKQLVTEFTPPEQHELSQLIAVFDKLPRVN